MICKSVQQMIAEAGGGTITVAPRPSSQSTQARNRLRRERKTAETPPEKRPRTPNRRYDCLNILNPTGRDATQSGCGGCGMTLTSIWGCAIHGDCAPFATGKIETTGVVKCRSCGDYEKPYPIPPAGLD